MLVQQLLIFSFFASSKTYHRMAGCDTDRLTSRYFAPEEGS